MTASKQSGYRSDTLTPTQTEVIRHVAQGLSNIEIAAETGIARRTVVNHIHSVLNVLRLHNRTQLTIYALKAGVISLDEIELPGYGKEAQ